jgi:Uma2 family endonuclease
LYTEEKKAGEVYTAPFDAYLDEHSNAVQPDIVFVSAAKLSIIDRYIHGVPDHDRIRKKALYERFGVSEYWIVDAATKMLLVTSIKMVDMMRSCADNTFAF